MAVLEQIPKKEIAFDSFVEQLTTRASYNMASSIGTARLSPDMFHPDISLNFGSSSITSSVQTKNSGKADFLYLKHSKLMRSQFKSEKIIGLEKALNVLSILLTLDPDQISNFLLVEDEASVHFTIKKDEFTFFVQFLVDPEDYDDQAILSVYRNDIKLRSHAGTFEEINCAIMELLDYKVSSFDFEIRSEYLSI